MLFFTYILYSSSLNKYYIGSTEDLARRLDEHNRGKGTFTSKGTPWILVYTEEYSSKADAFKRELSIKKRKSRVYIETLIAKGSVNPVL
jgi:putative endonuclease